MKISDIEKVTSSQTSSNTLSAIVKQICRNRAAIPLISCAIPGIVSGAPIGEQIVSGSATISRPDNLTTIISQDSNKSIINWQQFNIAEQESVNFIQPDTSAVTLNRVVGGDPSTIFGQLAANGQVYLVNTHGVYFGASAKVDVSGLVASGLDIDNNDFLNNINHFKSTQVGQINNDGQLAASDSGYIVLIGEAVDNNGTIEANSGQIGLGVGTDITLATDNSGLISLIINKEALTQAGINNTGQVIANGGRIYITASLADSLAAKAVNNSGFIQATGIQEVDGEIFLVGSGGNITNNGAISADADTGTAGLISIKSNKDIVLDSLSQITANGGNTNADGGEIRVIADGTLNVKQGSITRVDGGLIGGNGGFLEFSGKDKIALNGQFSGKAHDNAFNNGSLLIDPQNINIAIGGVSLNTSGSQSANNSSDTPSSTLTVDPNMSTGGWTDVSLTALRDITVTDAISNTDIPTGGSLTLTAGQDINVKNNIGTVNAAFLHDLILQADRHIVIGDPANSTIGIYIGGNSNQLTMNADADLDNVGNIDISGDRSTVIQNTGNISLSANQKTSNISLSANHLIMAGGNTTTNTAKKITSASDIAITLSGDMSLTGGTVVNGTGTIDASVSISAANNIGVTLTGGDLTLQAGNVDLNAISAASIDVSAGLFADNNITVTSTGDINVRGGANHIDVSANTNSSASIFALADATIYADYDKNNSGDATLTANSVKILAAHDGTLSNSTQAITNGSDSITIVSNATVNANNVSINSLTGIEISAGNASIVNSGSSSSASRVDVLASAFINATNDTNINISGSNASLDINAGDASIQALSAIPSNLLTAADAGINSNRDVNVDIASGDLTVQGNTALVSITGSSLGSGFYQATAHARASIKANITTTGTGLSINNANNIYLYGGTSGLADISTNPSSSADAFADNSATLSGENISLNVANNVSIHGGSGSANALDLGSSVAGGTGSAQATLHADARIIAEKDINIIITDGDLTLTGGLTQGSVSGATSGYRTAVATANADIISTSSSQGMINTTVNGLTTANGTISLTGGQAGVSGVWDASSTASAVFRSSAEAGAHILNNGGDINITADNIMDMSGGIKINAIQTLGSSIAGSASIDVSARIGTASGTTTVTVTNGDLSLNGKGSAGSTSADGAVITHDDHVSIGGTQTNLVAGNDITIDTNLYNTDLPTGGSLSLSAGHDVNFVSNMGTSINRFAHNVSATAGNDINIGGSDEAALYIATNSVDLHADSNSDNIGNINLLSNSNLLGQGNVLLNTQGQIGLQANGMNIIGGQSSDGSAHITTSNTITANIGNDGITIKGGHVFASSGESYNVSAGLHADGDIAITITGGDLNVTAATATASIDSLASSFATANASAEISALGNIDITVGQGNVNISGGSASASIQAMDSSGLIADANASARISTSTSGNLTITADQITIQGGMATVNAFDGSSIGASSAIGFATANAVLSSNNVSISTNGDLALRGGTATAFAAASSSGTGLGSASAYGRIAAENNITISQNNTGNISITGGTAVAAAMYSDASFSGTGNAYALAGANVTAKQAITINNTDTVSIQGGSAQAIGLWSNTFASGASFASYAEANASINSTISNITINVNDGLTVNGGKALSSPQIADASSLGVNSGSAYATANAAVTANGIANISISNGGISWFGNGVKQDTISTSETKFRSASANIDGQQLNVDTQSLYINSDGDIEIPTSAVFVIGNGTQTAASGDLYLMNALNRNLLNSPETASPNLKIISSGSLKLEADVSFTGDHPYAWFIADSTLISSLNFTNANAATIQYTPYTSNLNTGVNNLDGLIPTSTTNGDNYYSNSHFSYMNSLSNANIIIGSSEYNGRIIIGEASAPELQNMNLGLLSLTRDGVTGSSSVITNGKVFTLWSSAFYTDTLIPVTTEFSQLDDNDLATKKEKKSRHPDEAEPLIKISASKP